MRKKNDTTPPKTLLREFLIQFEKLVTQLNNGEKSKIVKEWTKHADTIGKKISVNTSSGKITGISQGIDNDGALKIKKGKVISKIFVGDVVMR